MDIISFQRDIHDTKNNTFTSNNNSIISRVNESLNEKSDESGGRGCEPCEVGIVSQRRLSAARRDTHEPWLGGVRFRIPAGVLPGPGQEAEPSAGRNSDERAGLLRVSFRPEAVDVEIPLRAPLRRAPPVDRPPTVSNVANAKHIDPGIVQRQADPFRLREQRH